MLTKKELLSRPIVHLDIKQHNVVSLVDAMADMAFSSRDVHRASSIYEMMLRDTDCGVILCIAGSMVSAGMKQGFHRPDPQQHGRRNRFDGSEHR